MAIRKEASKKSFAEFVANAPMLEEAAKDDSVELTGLVSRTTDGRFAITVDTGQTFELAVEAVRDFREIEVPGAVSAAAVRVAREAISEAAVHTVKPTVKDLLKDPIKDIIQDVKHVITDPAVDQKSPSKDFVKDPLTDPPKPLGKDPVWDPKHPLKDTHKDPLIDPVKDPTHDAKHPIKDIYTDPLNDPQTFVPEGVGTGAADPLGGPDPGLGPVVNPAAPFVMATPHQAPQHLLAMQAGAPAAALTKYGLDQTQKEVSVETIKEMYADTKKEMAIDTQKEPVADTFKEVPHDTHKELVRDTLKEVVWDTLIEGPYTPREAGWDPYQMGGQPGFGGGY
jgi:hypothetical protein